MKRVLFLLSLVAVVIWAAGALLAAGDAKAGKEVYTKKCSTCHGQQGEGKETIAKQLKVEMKHLGSEEVQAKTDDEIRKIVLEGEGKMKPVKEMDTKAIEDVTAFVRTLKKK